MGHLKLIFNLKRQQDLLESWHAISCCRSVCGVFDKLLAILQFACYVIYMLLTSVLIKLNRYTQIICPVN